ncbi:stalk domain-containing protein [Paenibacillus shenyangensis]|uniref:stalk domain-containing protein n=1 Tax=Paenibacillus sp. A9 TaxID=1284352 RepID=UPI0009D992F2|nr:stalk domain-containing protein [Paenibacillus sp. A9]
MKINKYVIPLLICLCLGLCISIPVTTAKDNTVHTLGSISYIQASSDTSYATDKDGTTWTWGVGQNAGTGDNYVHVSPIAFTTPSASFKMIAPGSGIYTSAVTKEGLVYSWGVNDPSQQKTSSPVQVQGLKGIATTATGTKHFLALDNNGQVWGWGDNANGQLDKSKVNTIPFYNTPVRLSGLDQVKAIAASDNYSIALKKDGTLWGWGSISSTSIAPTLLIGGKQIVSATMNYGEVIAVNQAGKVLDWDLTSGMHAPKTYTLKLPVTSTDNGSAGVIYAITTNGSVWKIDPQSNQSAITQVSGLQHIVQIASGNSFTLALDQNGRVHSWGINDKGQLGIGNPFISASVTPVTVQKPIIVQLNKTDLRMPNPPLLIQNAVYVPVRGLFEKMNANVVWDKKNKNDVSITSGTTSIRLTKGKSTAIVNGTNVPLSSPPQYANESIFIPLRFISETIGAHVNWDSKNYTVSIDTSAEHH